MRLFCWICLCGLMINLMLIYLPASMRPYHVRHWLDDYKVELVEQTSEYGLAAKGIQRGRFSIQYSKGNRKLIDQIRQEWYQNIQDSKAACRADGHLAQYNEWGPSHIVRPDGIDVVEVGLVYSVPYSLGVIACGIPLLGVALLAVCKSATRRHLHKQHGSGIL